jgi:hypothetical protein
MWHVSSFLSGLIVDVWPFFGHVVCEYLQAMTDVLFGSSTFKFLHLSWKLPIWRYWVMWCVANLLSDNLFEDYHAINNLNIFIYPLLLILLHYYCHDAFDSVGLDLVGWGGVCVPGFRFVRSRKSGVFVHYCKKTHRLSNIAQNPVLLKLILYRVL